MPLTTTAGGRGGGGRKENASFPFTVSGRNPSRLAYLEAMMEADEPFDTDLEEDSVFEQLEIAKGNDEVENSGKSVQDVYLEACNNNEVFPSSRFLKRCLT